MKNLSRLGIMLSVVALATPQFAIAKEQKGKVAPKVAPPEAVQDLYSIVVAVAQYMEDSGKTLPPMQNTEVVKKAIWPYSQNEASFINSGTGKRYQPNTAVSGIKLSALQGKRVVLFYEPQASSGGKRWVLFLPKQEKNGDFDLRGNYAQYVKQITEKEWQQLHLNP